MGVLFQIRVESELAENFRHAAKRRGKTPDAYLLQVVKQAAASKISRRSAETSAANRLSYDLVSKMRADQDDE